MRRRLVPPLATAAVGHVAVAAGDRLPAVDGLAYFQAGRNLLDGAGYTRFGAPELHFPPLVPVSLGLLERLTGSEMVGLGSWNVLSGLAVVAALVGVGHRLWQDDTVTVAVAWLGGATTGLSPLFFRHGSGSESASLALLLGAVLVALGAFVEREGRRPWGRSVRLLGCGALVGLAYLARPEALVPGLLVGAVAAAGSGRRHAGRPMARPVAIAGRRGQGDAQRSTPRIVVSGEAGGPDPSRSRSRAMSIVGGGAFLLGLAVFVGPYVAYLHAHTGSWSLTAKSQDVSIDAWRAVAEGDRRGRDAYVYALSPDGTQLGAEARPLTRLAVEHPTVWLGIVRTNVGNVARAYLAPRWGYGPVWPLVPAPLVAVALIELWRRRRRPTTWLLAGIALVPVATCLAFFTLPRYLALPTAVLTLFAGKGMVRGCRSAGPRWGPVVAVVAGIFVGLSSLTEVAPFLPGHDAADPISHHDAGTWVASHTPRDARVMSRSFHVQAYADRPTVAMPFADYDSTMRFARLMGVSYVVADPRSPLYERLELSSRPPGLRLVAAFGSSSRPVRVYRLDPLPPASQREPIPLGYVGD